MRILFFGIALAFFTLITSCTETNDQPTVSGILTDAEGLKLSLMGFNNNKTDTLESKVLDKSGTFNFSAPSEGLNFYALILETKGSIILAFDSTESPMITASASELTTNYEVTGSQQSENIRELFVASGRYERSLDSTMTALRESATSGDDQKRSSLSDSYNTLRNEYKNYLLQFIDADTTKIANFTALQRLDPKGDFEYFKKVRNGLKPKMQGSFFFNQLDNSIAQVENDRKLSGASLIGQTAPDIILPNLSGESISLSSLRGKYVLIDFWASWCKPCRMENPNVVKLYNQYKEDNFEIYGVSLDKDRAKWQEAVAQDNLEWIHVSDLQFWNSAGAKLYNVRSIPFTALVDPDGTIIETKLRGAELKNKLAEIFGH